MEEECLAQRNAFETPRACYDEKTGLLLDPKMVGDAVKDELMFMRKLQVYHEASLSFLDKFGLKDMRTPWINTKKR